MENIGKITAEQMKLAASNFTDKRVIRERIETKIEEYKETMYPVSSIDEQHTIESIILGLKLALDILDES